MYFPCSPRDPFEKIVYIWTVKVWKLLPSLRTTDSIYSHATLKSSSSLTKPLTLQPEAHCFISPQAPHYRGLNRSHIELIFPKFISLTNRHPHARCSPHCCQINILHKQILSSCAAPLELLHWCPESTLTLCMQSTSSEKQWSQVLYGEMTHALRLTLWDLVKKCQTSRTQDRLVVKRMDSGMELPGLKAVYSLITLTSLSPSLHLQSIILSFLKGRWKD